ncbi:MAG: hypothetical protein Q9M15_00175 [Mariprofundaceae bacterium]|nr:hypothetical protein [Mariprofundaceae bacterium]
MCWVVVCYLGLPLSGHDVYVVGGIKINEPSADLVVLLAVLSSYQDRALPQDIMVFGEVGLTG